MVDKVLEALPRSPFKSLTELLTSLTPLARCASTATKNARSSTKVACYYRVLSRHQIKPRLRFLASSLSLVAVGLSSCVSTDHLFVECSNFLLAASNANSRTAINIETRARLSNFCLSYLESSFHS